MSGAGESSNSTSPTSSAPVRAFGGRVALSTASVYPESCVDAFARAATLGYDGVEVMVWTDPVSQEGATLARLSDHYGLPVLAVHAPTLLVSQRVWGREAWPKLERSCELARSLGADTVVAHPPFRWQREYAARFVHGVAELEERHGVRVAVENMFPWRAGQREVMAYLPGWDPVPQPYRNVTLDLSHSATAGVDALAMAHALGDRLVHLHLADGLGSPKDEHLVPGRGGQPCGELLGLLAERGWSGTVVIEVNTRRAKSRQERELDLAEALAFARLHLAGPVPARGPAPVPGPLPAPDEPLPVAVVEEAEAAEAAAEEAAERAVDEAAEEAAARFVVAGDGQAWAASDAGVHWPGDEP